MDVRIYVFLVATLFVTAMSRKSLTKPGSHGFVRFFVFEGILVLVLRNIVYWFSDPGSLNQIVSWILLLVSIYWILASVIYLSGAKRASGRSEPELFSFEKTGEIVTTGPFRYIRHPMYSSLLFLAWGAGLKYPDAFSLFLVLLTTVLIVVMSRQEELENLKYFGPEYRTYMAETKRFIPFLF